MHQYRNKTKAKGVKAKRNKTGPDENKAKLEDVQQTVFNFLTTSVELNYHNFVKTSMNNSLKEFDNNPLDKLKKLDKKGNSFMNLILQSCHLFWKPGV